jgi:hypothetical protein
LWLWSYPGVNANLTAPPRSLTLRPRERWQPPCWLPAWLLHQLHQFCGCRNYGGFPLSRRDAPCMWCRRSPVSGRSSTSRYRKPRWEPIQSGKYLIRDRSRTNVGWPAPPLSRQKRLRRHALHIKPEWPSGFFRIAQTSRSVCRFGSIAPLVAGQCARSPRASPAARERHGRIKSVLIDLTVLHDQEEVLPRVGQYRNIGERIAGDEQNVC